MRHADWADSIFWMYTILIDTVRFGMNSRELMQKMGGVGIQARPLWQPTHLSPAHTGSYSVDCSTSEWLNRDALSLPCSVGLTMPQFTRVVDAVISASCGS
jgi:perosamine synthetase